MISTLLYGTSTLASPRVPPMIGFAFLCVSLTHSSDIIYFTAMDAFLGLFQAFLQYTGHDSSSERKKLETQSGWGYACLRLLPTFTGVLHEKIHAHASLGLSYQGVYLFVLSNTSVKLN